MTSTSTNREENMKALIDAAAQVSGGPSIPFPFPNLYPAAAIGITNSMVLANNQGGPLRKRDHESALSMKGAATASASGAKKAKPDKSSNQEDECKRVKRLEQNRTAAIESRRRKKHMVEELQRSVQYFSRANSALKSQNAELERQLLFAKHKILAKGSSGEVAASTITKVTLPSAPLGEEHVNVKEAVKETTKPIAKLRPASSVTSSFLTSAPPNKELEEQARQAQFAATQALYKSMGYPAGAARIAASTFSQFVGQTGIAPGLSASDAVATSRESVPPSKRNSINTTSSSSILPYAATSLPLNLAEIKPSVKVESDGDAYIEALNQFAMQQAAAANAAAAAATAAIQAVNIHNQLKHSGAAFSSSSSSSMAPSFSFSIPNTDMKSWPFQNASPFSMKE